MKKLIKILFAASLFYMACNVYASPISGSIGFTGAYTHDGFNLSDATTITPTNAEVAGVVTGSFAAAGITAGDSAAYSAFTFNPITTPVANIWSVAHSLSSPFFSFELTSMTVDFQTSSLLALSGRGIISSTDTSLENSPGSWTFTANETGSNMTWSSGTAVPVPAALWLFGSALLGLAGFKRKQALA